MRTQQAPAHEEFVAKNSWRIFDPKDLDDISLHTVQVFSARLLLSFLSQKVAIVQNFTNERSQQRVHQGKGFF